MAKKKTNIRNKASILENDPRVNMYQGKDRELTNDDEETEAKLIASDQQLDLALLKTKIKNKNYTTVY